MPELAHQCIFQFDLITACPNFITLQYTAAFLINQNDLNL